MKIMRIWAVASVLTLKEGHIDSMKTPLTCAKWADLTKMEENVSFYGVFGVKMEEK